jgi:hypothetical protein
MTTQSARSTSSIWATTVAGALGAALLIAAVVATGPADANQVGSVAVEAQQN